MITKTHTVTTILLMFIWGCSMFTSSSKPEPVDQFLEIDLTYNYGNELNTFARTLQEDLGMRNILTIPFTLTNIEQKGILAKMQSIGFYSLPDTLQHSADKFSSEEKLRIKYQNIDKTIIWYEDSQSLNPTNNRFYELLDFIFETIEAKSEFKATPGAIKISL
jgi:hypothetical protein